MARFFVVPQWQGSPAARAMLLSEGATAIAGDLPRHSTHILDVPLEAGDALGTGVLRTSAILRTREVVAEAVSAHADHTPILIGGDCSITLGALTALPGGSADVALIWCDAHPDLHTPDTSPSGAFSGMALRAALGHGVPELTLSPAVDPERVVLVGARAVDPGEHEPLAHLPLRKIAASDLHDPDVIAEAVAATGASRAYVHIDVDVIDPGELGGVSDPAPFGASVEALGTAVKSLRTRVPLAGATLAGFAPRSPAAAVDDLGALLRLVGALA